MNKNTKIAASFLIPLGLVSGYLVAGFYSLPAWLQHNLPALIKNETGLDANLNTATFNPLSFTLNLTQFEIPQMMRFENLHIQLNLRESLLSKSVVIESIELEKPFLKIEKQSDGKLNTDVFSAKSNKTNASENKTIFPFYIKKLNLSQSEFNFKNNKLNAQIKPLNFSLSNLSSTQSEPAKFELTAICENGGELKLNGDFAFSTFTSTGELSLQKIQLPYFVDFIPNSNFKLSGSGELVAQYQFEWKPEKSNIQLKNGRLVFSNLNYQNKLKLHDAVIENASFDGLSQQIQFKTIALNDMDFLEKDAQFNLSSLKLDKLDFNLEDKNLQISDSFFKNAQLLDASQNTVLFKLPELALNKLELNFKKKSLSIHGIQAKNADLKAWLNPNGELNYQTLLPEDEPAVESEKEAGNGTSETFWGIKVDDVEFTDFSASFEDKTLPTPTTITLKPLSLKLNQLSNALNEKRPFELKTGINNSGALHLKGNAGLNPLNADAEIDVTALGLDKFQSYVDKFAHLDLIKGIFNLEGKVDVVKGEQGELDVKFRGNTGISRLITRDQVQNKDLLKWDNLTLKNVEADLLAQRYSASTLLLEKPYVRVVIDKNKTLNFSEILNQSSTAATKKENLKKSENTNSDIHFKLDKIKISNGASSFADLSMILPFSAEIRGLEGGAEGVSSEREAVIDVSLKGNAYDLAPVDIKGKIKPFVGDYNAALNFKGMPLPLMSAYMAEFAGYKFEKGKMSLGMNYDVTKGELSATNNLWIEQIELGDKIDNPHAIDAPIDLAIALLKDMNGTINLDVPVTGSLNDPHFNFSGVVSDALFNIITKVITSPFQAVANLLGTEDDLSVVQFSAGESELSDWQKQKLDGLAKVLRERETLKLEIKGAAFQHQDWTVLREIALIDRLKTLKADEINQKNKQKILPEYVELSDEDIQRLLAQEFKMKFPQLVKKSFWGNLELTNPEMGEFYDVAKRMLLDNLPVEQKRLTKLAAARARMIAKYVVQQGGVPNERIFILDTAIDPERENDEINVTLFLT